MRKPKRYWVSWVSQQSDWRGIGWPMPAAVLGAWCSGYDASDCPVVCVLVEAASVKAAKALVADGQCWPETAGIAFRFIEEKPADWVPGDRFPLRRKEAA